MSLHASHVGVHPHPLHHRGDLGACHRCGIRRKVTSKKRRPPLCRDCLAAVKELGETEAWA